MKKQYISPEMEIVKIQTMQMIAASPESGFTKSAAVELEDSDTSGNLSRGGRGFWDDEE